MENNPKNPHMSNLPFGDDRETSHVHLDGELGLMSVDWQFNIA
jgi:hypothetical protein